MHHKYNKKALEDEIKRSMFPEGFRLEAGAIGIDVVDRTYGVICECGSKEFTEDEEFVKIFCSDCGKTLAIRAAVQVGWVNEED